MAEIILVRHGQTEWNVGEIFRGRVEIELDATGITQAQLLAQYLSGREIEAIYSSPLSRALQTAEVIAAPHRLKVRVSPNLNDLAFGKWQGLTLEEVRIRFKRSYATWVEAPDKARIPGGETLNKVTERALTFVQEVVRKHRGTVVLVSHRVVIKCLILALLGLDNSHFWNIKLDTASISIFSYADDRFVLNEHNNTCHLRPLHLAALRDF